MPNGTASRWTSHCRHRGGRLLLKRMLWLRRDHIGDETSFQSHLGDWTRYPPAKSFRLVCGRPLDVIDDEDLDGTFGQFEFKSELFLQSGKD